MKEFRTWLLAKGLGCAFVVLAVLACFAVTGGLLAQRLVQVLSSSR